MGKCLDCASLQALTGNCHAELLIGNASSLAQIALPRHITGFPNPHFRTKSR
jgi:hypothetical protein